MAKNETRLSDSATKHVRAKKSYAQDKILTNGVETAF